MYYFDNKLLQQYLDQKRKIKVFVDSNWYDIASQRDIQDGVSGYGTDRNGEVHTFDFRDIEKIMVGNLGITIDQLQTMKGSEPETKEKPETPPESEEEPMGDEELPEEEPSKEKEPDLSWYSPMFDIGRNLIKERRKMNQ